MSSVQTASVLQLLGAGCFGALIGWYVYYINRYRKEAAKLSDLVTLVGVLGGGSILALFPSSSNLFGAYGVGLSVGFFGYFVLLNVYVKKSDNFSFDWFLDGRRKKPVDPWYVPEGVANTVTPMGKKTDEERG